MTITKLETKDMKIKRLSDEALASVQAEALAKVNPYRDELLAIGFEYSGAHIQCDTGSQNNLMGMVIKSEVLTFPIQWRTYENTIIDLSETALTTIATSMMAFVQTVFNDSWTVKDAISSATDSAEVETLIETYLN